MKNKILKELRPFKKPLIAPGILLILLFVVYVVLPAVNGMAAGASPVVSIEAVNTHEYNKGDEVPLSDFTVTAMHENGKSSKLGTADFEISDVSFSPVGKSTAVTVYYTEDHDIKCETEISIAREKIVGFQCGYPEVSDVTAVLYSNGELCFEGEGDVLVCSEGDFPWLNYDGMDDYPITAISFEDGVTPTDMNYWFEEVETLTYIGKIPPSVKTMAKTFAGCTGLTMAADWSDCTGLLNINQTYEECLSLVSTCPLPASARTAYRTYAGCVNLPSCPDSSGAMALIRCVEMYASCTGLVSAEIGPSAVYASGMFEDCINLKDMPSMPGTLLDISNIFSGDVSLTNLAEIPESVNEMSQAFYGCELIQGELPVSCNAESFSGMFEGACVATKVSLTGQSGLLDAYANTNDYGNVSVNGQTPDPEILSYDDVYGENGTLAQQNPDSGDTDSENSQEDARPEGDAEADGGADTEDTAMEG